MVEKKLLVISSDSGLFSGLERAWAGRPLEVQLAPDSAEARRLVNEFKPDAFLIDLHLPDGNGFAVFGALKRNLALKNKIFLICADDKDAAAIEQHRKLRKHAERYLIKPFSPDTLYNALAPMLMLPLAEIRREVQPPPLDVAPLDLPEPTPAVLDGGAEKGAEEEVLDELDSLLGDINENVLDTLVASKEADLSELDEMLGVEPAEEDLEEIFEPVTIREKAPEPQKPQKAPLSEELDILDSMKEIIDAELDSAVEESLVEDLNPEEIASDDSPARSAVKGELAEVLEDESTLDKIVEEALGSPSELDDEIVQAVLEDVERDTVTPEQTAADSFDFESEEIVLPAEKPLIGKEAHEAAADNFKAMLERRLSEALEALEQERASLEMVRRQVAQLEEKFTIADSENRRLHRELSEKDEEQAALQDRLLRKDDELGSRTDVLKNRETELNSLNSDLAEANRQLRQIEETLSAEREAKAQLESALQEIRAARDAELAASRTEMNELRRSMQENLAQVEEKCSRMEHSCSSYAAERDELMARLQNKEAECAALESQLNEMRTEHAAEVRNLESHLLELEHSHKENLGRLESEHTAEISEVRRLSDERVAELVRALEEAERSRDGQAERAAEIEKRYAAMEEHYASVGQTSQDSDVRIELLEAEAEELRENNTRNEQRLVKAYALIKSEMEARARAEQKLKQVQELLGLNK